MLLRERRESDGQRPLAVASSKKAGACLPITSSDNCMLPEVELPGEVAPSSEPPFQFAQNGASLWHYKRGRKTLEV